MISWNMLENCVLYYKWKTFNLLTSFEWYWNFFNKTRKIAAVSLTTNKRRHLLKTRKSLLGWICFLCRCTEICENNFHSTKFSNGGNKEVAAIPFVPVAVDTIKLLNGEGRYILRKTLNVPVQYSNAVIFQKSLQLNLFAHSISPLRCNQC